MWEEAPCWSWLQSRGAYVLSHWIGAESSRKKASSLCHFLSKTSRNKDTTNVSEVPLEKVACASITGMTPRVREGSMDMLIRPLNNSLAPSGKLLPD